MSNPAAMTMVVVTIVAAETNRKSSATARQHWQQ
jgi:hypothetical protein